MAGHRTLQNSPALDSILRLQENIGSNFRDDILTLMALIWTWIFVVPLFALATIVCGAFSIAASLSKKRGRVMMGAAARVWGGMLVKIAGVRITVEGLEKIDPNGAYVFASNHLSYMDTPVVLSQIPVQFRFMAKSGLFKIPFLGTHLAQAGHIPVPREERR
jgi:1-acyl-sn-glycerol-3-phosphate acyltransferase